MRRTGLKNPISAAIEWRLGDSLAKTRPVRKKAADRVGRKRVAWRGRLGWRGWLTLTVLVLVIGVVGAGMVTRLLAPTGNTVLTRFDAIIVLGYPADRDGNPTPEQLARVTEAVHEYERGVAPRLIMSGGAAHNRFVEARVMAATAHAQGIPEKAIIEEPQARDTIENACYAVRIMNTHGWRSAEVVSSASHLPRAGILFNRMPIEWRAHAAPPLEPVPTGYPWAVTTAETVKTMRYLVWTRWREHCEP